MATDDSDRRHLMHPSRSAQTENRLQARHIDHTFEANLELALIRDVEGNQVRLSEHRAPKATVERYAQQMKAGAVFPAIVVNDRFEIVDGNSRWTAALRNKRSTIPAYICSGLSSVEARSLSVELNQCHGLSMTEDELRGFVTSAVHEGLTPDAKSYSRMTGVKAATLARWIGAIHFEMRAERRGLPAATLTGLSDTAKAALHVARLATVFDQVTELAVASRMSASDIKSLTTTANAAPSESEALAIIDRVRVDRTEDIKAIAAGFKGARRRSAGLSAHIGGLMRFDVDDLLDFASDKQVEMYERMNEARKLLDGALARARVEWDLEEMTEQGDAMSDRQTDDLTRAAQ